MQKTKEEIQSLSAEALMTSNQILEKIRFWIIDAAVMNKLNNVKTWESIEEIIRGFIHQVATKIVPKSEMDAAKICKPSNPVCKIN